MHQTGGTPGVWVALGLAMVVLLVPAISATPPPPAPAPVVVAAPAVSQGISASVTWNGESVADATTLSSAHSTNFGSTIDLHYAWESVGTTSSGSAPQYNISDARLQMFYFGFPLATRDVLDATPALATSGSFDLTWDPGVLQWLLAGTYGVTASLLSPNGTTVWSQAFFIHVTAPGGIGAILPILLILIAIYEVVDLARSGRQAALSAPSPPKPSEKGAPPSDATPPKEGP